MKLKHCLIECFNIFIFNQNHNKIIIYFSNIIVLFVRIIVTYFLLEILNLYIILETTQVPKTIGNFKNIVFLSNFERMDIINNC